MQNKCTMDAKSFYRMMFGSEDFEPLVGKMTNRLGQDMDEFDCPPGLDPERAKEWNMQLAKWKREVQCAVNLKNMIQPYVAGEIDEKLFRLSMKELGDQLGSSMVGRAWLGIVGHCYRYEALQAMGSWSVSGGLGDRVYATTHHVYNMGHVISNYSSYASSVAGAVQVSQVIQEQKDGRPPQMGVEHAEQMSRFLWNFIILEIEDVLSNVVFKVTHDTSVDREERALRANAIYIAGDVFCSYDTNVERGLQEVVMRFGGR